MLVIGYIEHNTILILPSTHTKNKESNEPLNTPPSQPERRCKPQTQVTKMGSSASFTPYLAEAMAAASA